MAKVKRDRKALYGIVDADLLDNGTRHPNLVLMKIAGYLRDHDVPYELIIDNEIDINKYSFIYSSKVFTFTQEPDFLINNQSHKIFRGGTGYYAEEDDVDLFNRLREEDLTRLDNDPLLPGFSMAHQMPDYSLYDKYVNSEIAKGKRTTRFKDYRFYSIGFLTRGCVRKCPFCVNKNINYVYNYSSLSDFVDASRPMIYLWDDNFFASKNWKELLLELQATNKPFQFRQGLDISVYNN